MTRTAKDTDLAGSRTESIDGRRCTWEGELRSGSSQRHLLRAATATIADVQGRTAGTLYCRCEGHTDHASHACRDAVTAGVGLESPNLFPDADAHDGERRSARVC